MPLVESISGIRGVYDDGLNETVAERYAYAYLNVLKSKYPKKAKNKRLRIVVGTDTRPSRDILKNAIIKILDCDIVDLGIASTPMTEFAVRHFEADGGIIITASHNEPYWNGFKFLDNDGSILTPTQMNRVINLYKKLKLLTNSEFSRNYLKYVKTSKKLPLRKIERKYKEINRSYVEYILNFLSKKEKESIKKSKLKVIIDPNGGTGVISKKVLESLYVKVYPINIEYGIFNRTIEPNEKSLFYLTNLVRTKQYDFAAGFDCDADRVELVTSKGIISGNQMLAVIADDILSRSKNKVVVVNDATSRLVKDIADKNGAKCIETPVGEINVVNKMKSLDAPIGGEGSSSGVIIPDSRCRDGILTLVFIIKILAEKQFGLKKLMDSLPRYSYVKEKIKINPKKINVIMAEIKKFYKKKGFKINDKLGSIKALDKDSFVLFKKSNTEFGVLRVIIDSRKEEKTELLRDEAVHLLKIYRLKN
jgi:phosphomannomutase